MTKKIDLDRQPNFRDMGGYVTASGHTLRSGRVFRSGELSGLSDSDLSTVAALGIRTVVDLRTDKERELRGKSHIGDGSKVIEISVDSGDLISSLIPALYQGEYEWVPLMLLQDLNRQFVEDCSEKFGVAMNAIVKHIDEPIVFHCTQGKDRAGFVAAMLLSALGVSWDVVVEDYLLTNEFRREDSERMLTMLKQNIVEKRGLDLETLDLPQLDAMFFVKRENLDAARDAILKHHGDFDAYFDVALGLDASKRDRLKKSLLQEAC